MAQKETLEQMLEHLVNDEQDKAEELFHEYVVAKSREIYESLIEEEMDDEDEDEEEVDESTEEDEDEEEVSEDLFDDDVIEADDDEDMMGGDETDDLVGDIESDDEMDMDDEEDMGDADEEELFQDLEDIVDELQAKFDELKGGGDSEEMDMDDEEDMDMGDEDEEMKDDFDAELATVREYVEKIGAYENAKGGDEGKGVAGSRHGTSVSNVNTKSVVDNMKNDMGGTTANILSDKTDEKGRTADKPKEDDMGNVNKPGGKASKSMSKVSGGAANSESGADNTGSLFRGKRS